MLNGTWEVQPALTPPSINIDNNIIIELLDDNHKLNAFNRGDIISHEHNIEGDDILPNPPIDIGIVIGDIINIPWKVIFELYWKDEHKINPGKVNSNRNIIGKLKPINPPIDPNIIYINPIYIWLVIIIKEIIIDNLDGIIIIK